MQILIEIPEEAKQAFDRTESNDPVDSYYDLGGVIGMAIKNGIPLPERHGRLIDEDILESQLNEVFKAMEEVPTIIPATKEKNSEKVIGTDVCSLTDKVCIGKDCRTCVINNQTATKEGKSK